MAEVSELSEIILPVEDLAAQLAFYRDQLGLPVKAEAQEAVTRAELDSGACSLVLDAGQKPGPGRPRTRLVFKVDDLDDARARLAARGVRLGAVYSPRPGYVACDGSDPEGNPFSLQSSSEPLTTTTLIRGASVPRAGNRRMWAV